MVSACCLSVHLSVQEEQELQCSQGSETVKQGEDSSNLTDPTRPDRDPINVCAPPLIFTFYMQYMS
jgi:hypothetical protein